MQQYITTLCRHDRWLIAAAGMQNNYPLTAKKVIHRPRMFNLPLYKPLQAVSNQLKVGGPEIVQGDHARVPQGFHDLRECCKQTLQ
jgi:hypothetical protein